MATVNIRFVGPWRLYLSVDTIALQAGTVEGALAQVEDRYGPRYHARLLSRGVKIKRSITDDSNILLNRINIRQLSDHRLKEGDHMDLIPRFVGG